MSLLEDDDLFEGLVSEAEPLDDFDVSRLVRAINKLQYKLEKQKEYKKRVTEQLNLGITKTADTIESLKNQIKTYMINSSKKKLTFDDLGTISLVTPNPDWVIPNDDEVLDSLIKQLESKGLIETVKINKTLDLTKLKKLLNEESTGADLATDLDLKKEPRPQHLQFRV